MYMYMHMHMYMYMYMHMYMYISISGQPLCTPLVSHLSYSPPPPYSQVRCAAFSPDGRFLIFGGFGEELHICIYIYIHTHVYVYLYVYLYIYIGSTYIPTSCFAPVLFTPLLFTGALCGLFARRPVSDLRRIRRGASCDHCAPHTEEQRRHRTGIKKLPLQSIRRS